MQQEASVWCGLCGQHDTERSETRFAFCNNTKKDVFTHSHPAETGRRAGLGNAEAKARCAAVRVELLQVVEPRGAVAAAPAVHVPLRWKWWQRKPE